MKHQVKTRVSATLLIFWLGSGGAVIALLATEGPTITVVEAFSPTTTKSHMTMTTRRRNKVGLTTTRFLSHVPHDEDSTSSTAHDNDNSNSHTKNKKSPLSSPPPPPPQNSHRSEQQQHWLPMPEPPEDQLTLAGDVASLFLYAAIDHFLNDVCLSGILASSTSAADAAKTLDPSGASLTLAATPVWLDTTTTATAYGVDQIMLADLSAKVTPHFTPLFCSAGVASVSLASCWIVAGLVHEAFHYRNTLDCSTHRAVFVTGQTWLTFSCLLILLACASQHYYLLLSTTGEATTAVSTTSVLMMMMEGRTMGPIEEWFSVLTRSDAAYVVDSLGVLLTWRCLLSFMVGGWSK